MHACESYWSDPRLGILYSRIRGEWSQYAQGKEGREDKLDSKSDYTRVYTVYTLDVLLSKLLRSISVSSNGKALTHHSLLIAYLIVLTDALS